MDESNDTFVIETVHQGPRRRSRNIDDDSISCPIGLEYLDRATSVFVKPYSGPHVIGHVTANNRFEVLNHEGKRIFLITNNYTHKSKLKLSEEVPEDERRETYPMFMAVFNHSEDEVFQYYGVAGKMLKVGPNNQPSWGTVTRIWTNIFHFSFSDYARYDVIMEQDQEGIPFEEMETSYIIEGQKTRSCCPTPSTKKLYFGTFLYGIYEATKNKTARSTPHPSTENVETATMITKTDDGPIARVSSSLICSKLAVALPGVEFSVELDVINKAVLLGVLFIDIIRH